MANKQNQRYAEDTAAAAAWKSAPELNVATRKPAERCARGEAQFESSRRRETLPGTVMAQHVPARA